MNRCRISKSLNATSPSKFGATSSLSRSCAHVWVFLCCARCACLSVRTGALKHHSVWMSCHHICLNCTSICSCGVHLYGLIRLEQRKKPSNVVLTVKTKIFHCLFDRVLERKKTKTWNGIHKAYVLVLGLPFAGCHHGLIRAATFLNLCFSIYDYVCLVAMSVWEKMESTSA